MINEFLIPDSILTILKSSELCNITSRNKGFTANTSQNNCTYLRVLIKLQTNTAQLLIHLLGHCIACSGLIKKEMRKLPFDLHIDASIGIHAAKAPCCSNNLISSSVNPACIRTSWVCSPRRGGWRRTSCGVPCILTAKPMLGTLPSSG